MPVATADLFAEPDLGEDEPPPAGWQVAEWALVVGGAVLVALLLKTFVVQSFFIPSESMEPTMVKDDRILVDKLSYRVRPVATGDVVVFDRPPALAYQGHDHLVKRVVATGGQRVTFEQGAVFVDGRRLPEPYLSPGTVTEKTDIRLSWDHSCAPTDPCVVPAGHVWLMGDNRDRSADSRSFGPVPLDDVVGRAVVTVWPFDRVQGL